MINIHDTVIREQKSFWNHCLFHPTDAVEDPWGKRILDRISKDRSIGVIRIYTMFEDIVYLDEKNALQYDFRVSDLRLDYLVEKGFDLLLAYGGMPDCIASRTDAKTSVSYNKTRYKGKMWNSAPPRDYAQWEEICYEYTKHIIERYGIERVSKWRFQCFNEPDVHMFFLSDLPCTEECALQARLPAYCRLYEAFANGVLRASNRVSIGGPALALFPAFLGGLLDYVREHCLRMDFISVHNYGTSPSKLAKGIDRIAVSNQIKKQLEILQVIREHGFSDLPILLDEWGMATGGFRNVESCPSLIARETEVFSAYYVKLIREMLDSPRTPDSLMICLSGQHEMVSDFTGFRNFFTLHFIAKPIYNAHLLASKLGEELLAFDTDSELLSVIPTRNEDGNLSVLLSYSSEYFEETLADRVETLSFDAGLRGKTVTVYAIDREHTNPYRLFERMGSPETLSEEQILALREEGDLCPVSVRFCELNEPIELKLTANSTYLITVTNSEKENRS